MKEHKIEYVVRGENVDKHLLKACLCKIVDMNFVSARIFMPDPYSDGSIMYTIQGDFGGGFGFEVGALKRSADAEVEFHS